MIPLILASLTATPVSETVRVGSPVAFAERGQSKVVEYDGIAPKTPFQEAIVSWNVDEAKSASMDIEIRAHQANHTTKWYRIGTWTYDLVRGIRETVNGQRDTDGTVSTDTLSLHQPAESVDVRLTLRTVADGNLPRLKLLTVAFSPADAEINDQPTPSPAWGKTISVLKRCQGNYPRGGGLCSATSSSMLRNYWSTRLGQPELDEDVPFVESAVWDKVYQGTGNWPFNTAFLGAVPGLVSYVSRLNSIAELESWIAAGYPLACSVSYDMVRGRPLSPTEQGHLMVLVGFSATGDPIFNDPARHELETTTYRRADFERAWVYSNRTVYLVYPEGATVPMPLRTVH